MNPASPTAPPPPPHWTGFLTTGAPNPAVSQLGNAQSSAFNRYMALAPSFNTPSHTVTIPHPPQAHPPHAANQASATQQRKASKLRKSSQNNKNLPLQQVKNAGASNGQNQDQRPSKKARTSPLRPAETLNQSMQRIGSGKASKPKQTAKAGKKRGSEIQTLAVKTAAIEHADDLGHADEGRISEEREKAKSFLKVMHANNVSFVDLVHEGLDSRFLRELYDEIGIDLNARVEGDGFGTMWDDEETHQDGDEDVYEPTDEPNSLLGPSLAVPPAQRVHNMAPREPSVPPTNSAMDQSQSAPISREDYLERLRAVRSGQSIPAMSFDHSMAPTTTGNESSLPQGAQQGTSHLQGALADIQQAPNLGSTGEDLARAKDRARKAFAASRAARKARQSSSNDTPQEAVVAILGTTASIDAPAMVTQAVEQEQDIASHLDPFPHPVGAHISAEIKSPTPFAVPEGSRLPGLFMEPAAISSHETPNSEPYTVQAHTVTDDPETTSAGLDKAQDITQDDAESEGAKSIQGAVEDPSVESMTLKEVPELRPAIASNSEDFIKFGEGDDLSFSGFQRSFEPGVPGLTAISRHRPHSAAPSRPAIQATTSWDNQWRESQSKIEDMKRKIQLAELKAKVKASRTASPGTPQMLHISATQPQEDASRSLQGTDASPHHQVSSEIPESQVMPETAVDASHIASPHAVIDHYEHHHEHQPQSVDTIEPSHTLAQTVQAEIAPQQSLPSSSVAKPPTAGGSAMSRSLRRAQIESLLSESRLESESDLSRMALLKAQLQELEDQARRKRETNERLAQELESLGVDTENIPTEELQDRRDKAVASLDTSHSVHTPSEHVVQGSASPDALQAKEEQENLTQESIATAPMSQPHPMVGTAGASGAIALPPVDSPVLLAASSSNVSSSSSSELAMESEQLTMDIDSGSEGEIIEDEESSHGPLQLEQQSEPSVNQVPYLAHPPPPLEARSFNSHVQEERSNPSPGEISAEMDFEVSSASSEEGEVSSDDGPSEEDDYSPEPSTSINLMQQSDVQQDALSISSDQSEEGSEEYEPAAYEPQDTQPDPATENSDIPDSETDGENEEDYEPPDASMEPAEPDDVMSYVPQNAQNPPHLDMQLLEGAAGQGSVIDDANERSELESGERSSASPSDVDSIMNEP